MPGIIIFNRRWSVGSDDMILPSFMLLSTHIVWLIILSFLILRVNERDWRFPCMSELYEQTVGYLIIFFGCIITETCICWVSSQGTIMNTRPRASMPYLLYVRCGIIIVELIWIVNGFCWSWNNYEQCDHGNAKDVIIAISLWNAIVICILFMIGWCAFDSAGRSWVKMKRYQNSLKENQSKYRYKRSGSTHRNWRHRKAVRQYQDSWNRRCKLLFCCLGRKDKHQNSFTEIAKLLSEFFRDLDVVPSDVVAGLIIIRKQQKLQRQLIANQGTGGVYKFLSGAAITGQSRFVDLNKSSEREKLSTVAYYLDYAMAVYGWPLYMMLNKSTGCCRLCSFLNCDGSSGCLFKRSCCWKNQNSSHDLDEIESQMHFERALEDNCCSCNYTAMKKILSNKNCEIVYSTYHVEIGEPPFLVAVDHTQKAIVLSIRGTLSPQDIITDLNAEGDIIPTEPIQEHWLAHKGMIEAAVYLRQQLQDLKLIERALDHGGNRIRTRSYTIVLVGHSLGAGTASILAIMLRQKYPDVTCYAYSPPGGLLSLEAAQYSKSFITSVVLGKDVVPRLGLHQMESLRFDLINAIQQCKLPKWQVIGTSLCCCRNNIENTERLLGSRLGSVAGIDSQSIGEMSATVTSVATSTQAINAPAGGTNSVTGDNSEICEDATIISLAAHSKNEKELSAHPNDASIALTVHQPLYPPGEIIHIVRNHIQLSRTSNSKHTTYQAIYADNIDFDQILITPVMISDHMPNRLVEAFNHLMANDQEETQRVTRPLLADQSSAASPLLAYEYGSSWSEQRPGSLINVQPATIHSSALTHYENHGNVPALQQIKQETVDLQSVSVDLATDDWLGTAPLATPEVASESSSICSHSRSGSVQKSRPKSNDGINYLGVKTVSEMIQAAVTTSQKYNNEVATNGQWIATLPKLDLQLNIDVNALFDQFANENRSPAGTTNNTNTQTEQNTQNDFIPSSMGDNGIPVQSNIASSHPKMTRVSSLRRANSVSSGKRVTFHSSAFSDQQRSAIKTNITTVSNGTSSTSSSLINRMETVIRRVNSERINKKRNNFHSFGKNKMPCLAALPDDKCANVEHTLQTAVQACSLSVADNQMSIQKSQEEECENRTNERLEQELQQILGNSLQSIHFECSLNSPNKMLNADTSSDLPSETSHTTNRELN